MRYNLKNLETQKETSLHLPCEETKIQRCCDELGIKNDMFAKVYVVAGTSDEKLGKILYGTEHVLDELNFLEKRLDNFGEDESNTFYATVTARKMNQMKELINLTFNTHCYCLLADFSNLNELGESFYLNEHGSASVAFLKEFNGQKIY